MSCSSLSVWPCVGVMRAAEAYRGNPTVGWLACEIIYVLRRATNNECSEWPLFSIYPNHMAKNTTRLGMQIVLG